MMYYKSLKIRLLPTKEQEDKMWEHIHASRFIWNYMIALQEYRYENGLNYLSHFDMNKQLTLLKKEEQYTWLNNVSCSSLQKVCGDVNTAYQKFFQKIARHPKFKTRKKSKPIFPLSDSIGKTYFTHDYIHIQNIGKVKYKTNYIIPVGKDKKMINPRVSNINGKWIITVGFEYEKQVFNHNGKMGIDLGVKDLAIVSYNGNKIVFPNINKSKHVKNLESKLTFLQHKVSRKYNTNNSYEKTKAIEKIESKIKDIYNRISNIRLNYIHQCTHKLVSILPEQIVMEDLNITGMMRNKYLSKAIQGQCFYEFIRQMKYKCEWNGIRFLQVNRFYPSSKTCSCCGNIKKDLKLSDRIYYCNKCGLIIDRDYNAAINLMNYST